MHNFREIEELKRKINERTEESSNMQVRLDNSSILISQLKK